MSGMRKQKPSDREALGQRGRDTDAEQTREAQESNEARNSKPSIRERMVNIGRGNQQAARHNESK